MSLSDRDAGFTLIELLVAVVILGIIAFPLGNTVISYLHNGDATVTRLSESHDSQMAQSYWAQDVASIGTRTWGNYPFPLQQSVWTAAGGISNPCATTGTTVVQFSWDDVSGGALPATVPQKRVAYVVEILGSERQLHRLTCTATSSSAASVAQSDIVLVHNLSTAGSDTQVAAVSCSSTCTAAPAVPATVTLALTIDNPKDTGGPYVVSLTGQRRQT